MNLREQSINRRLEYRRIVMDCLKHSDFKYFTCKKIARLTGLPAGSVRVGLKVLHKEGMIEKSSKHNWRKNNGI